MAQMPPTDRQVGIRARDLVRTGKRSEAEQLIRQALFDVNRGILRVGGEDAIYLGEAALNLELAPDATSWARHAATCDLTPDQAVYARGLLVVALKKQNLLDEAYKVIRSAGQPPGDASADALFQLHLNEGAVLNDIGRPEEALRRYEQADGLAAVASIDPASLAFLETNRGVSLNRVNRSADAIPAYRHALDLGVGTREEPSVRINLANALRKLERYEEAQEQYELAYDASDDPRIQGQALSNHARLLLATGHRSQAKKMMERAFFLRGEGADLAGQAHTAAATAQLYVEDAEYRLAALFAHTAREYRETANLPNDPGLDDLADNIGAIVAQLDQQPEREGDIVVDRLRTVMPGNWELSTALVPQAALEAALKRLWRESGQERALARAVEDRWIAGYLDRIIAAGYQLATAELTERLARFGDVVRAVREFIGREHWIERKRFYESARAILEDPVADDALLILELRAQDADLDRAAIGELRELVASCREKGVDQAFAELPEMYPGELINRFVGVGTWRESMLIIEVHTKDLINDDTIGLLVEARDAAGLLQRAHLEQHITVLKRSREIGIQRAFEEAAAAEGQPLGLKRWEASIHLERSEAALVDRFEKASDRLEKAKATVELVKPSNQPDLVRRAKFDLGGAYLSSDGGDRAANLRAALQTFDEVLTDGLPAIDMSEVWLNVGAAHLELATLKHDDDHLNSAITAYRKAWDESPIRTAPERARIAARGVHDSISLYLDLPRTYPESLYFRQIRSNACKTAIEATDELIRGGEVRDPATERIDWLWAYQRVVEDQAGLGRHAAALAAAESGRGRGFLAEVSQIERLPQTVPAPLADAEATIRARLRAARAAGEQRAIDVAISELRAIYDKIAEIAPELAIIRRAAAPTADDLSAIAGSLGSRAVVLAWYTTPSACFAFLLRGEDGTVLSTRTPVAQGRLDEFVRLAARDLWQRPTVADQPISPGWTQLAGDIVPEAWRRFIEAAETLVLVPHGPLSDIPLHALPHRWMGGRSLIEIADVSYLPGLALGHRLRRLSTTGQGALVLAHSGKRDNEAGESPFELEARAVAKVLNTPHLYMGSRARLSVLTEHAANASIIHIAAHGVFSPSDPLGSLLMLSDGTSDGSEPLTARDVLQLPRLSSRAIVLSGCETSRHSTDLGGESDGLMRAFLVAGASAVVAAKWKVDSPSTARLMERFHTELQFGHSIAGALRTASLELKSTHGTQHPYYWAPFVSMGA